MESLPKVLSRPKYVALKILTAKSSSSSTELSILEHLSEAAPEDPDSFHITQLLDSFKHAGPNGIHQCLVFEPMGATAASLVGELPENKPKMYGKPQRYPKWMAKKILHHALRGLSFLHQNGVVHGDLQPGNLLFSINNIDQVEQQELAQDEAETAIPLVRIDGKTDRWAPTNLYQKQSLHRHVQLDQDLRVTISDLGAGKIIRKRGESLSNTSRLTKHSFLCSTPTTQINYTSRTPRTRAHSQPGLRQQHRHLEPWVSDVRVPNRRCAVRSNGDRHHTGGLRRCR